MIIDLIDADLSLLF